VEGRRGTNMNCLRCGEKMEREDYRKVRIGKFGCYSVPASLYLCQGCGSEFDWSKDFGLVYIGEEGIPTEPSSIQTAAVYLKEYCGIDPYNLDDEPFVNTPHDDPLWEEEIVLSDDVEAWK
jgi:hypothetical protein